MLCVQKNNSVEQVMWKCSCRSRDYSSRAETLCGCVSHTTLGALQSVKAQSLLPVILNTHETAKVVFAKSLITVED